MPICHLYITHFYIYKPPYFHPHLLLLLILTICISNGMHSVPPIGLLKSLTPKKQMIRHFYTTLSSSSLTSTVCAMCGGRFPISSMLPEPIDMSSYNVSLLQGEYPLTASHPFPNHPLLHNILLCLEGVVMMSSSNVTLRICHQCHRTLKRGHLPKTAVANDLFFGPIPLQLANLTIIEEVLIAQRHAKSWIVHLHDDSMTLGHSIGPPSTSTNPTAQQALKGHVIVFPAKPEALTPFLPPTLEDVLTALCVVFVSHTTPTKQWLLKIAHPLVVRQGKVRWALVSHPGILAQPHNHF
jgi:hypothetical protein